MIRPELTSLPSHPATSRATQQLTEALLSLPYALAPAHSNWVEHLDRHPRALAAPSQHCSASPVRLLHRTVETGSGDKVTKVACGGYGWTSPLPTEAGAHGRLCSRCLSRYRHR